MKPNLLFTHYPFISGERVTLNRITELDLKSLWDIMSDDDNYRYTPTGAIQNKNSLQLFYQRIDSLFMEKKRIVLGIYPVQNPSKLVGILELSNLNRRASKIEFSIMLNRDYSGRGLAQSAVQAMQKYLFETVLINRIEIYAMPINIRCKRLLSRCDFVKEGTIREGFYWPDKGIVDLDLYAALASDYAQAQRDRASSSRHVLF